MDREVTLMEMLEAREVRAGRQRELLERYARPVVSFTLNIAGPVKNDPVIRRAFREGLLRLEDALAARGLRVCLLCRGERAGFYTRLGFARAGSLGRYHQT